MDATKIGKKISNLRKERGYTQENLAALLDISPQAVSKWENGHALPETTLLPLLAKALDMSIDSLLNDSHIQILSAFYGDGMENHNVANRLNKLIENDVLEMDVNAVSLACAIVNIRPKFLIVKYQTNNGIFFTFTKENNRLAISSDSNGFETTSKAEIIAAVYGTAKAHNDVIHKIEHYKVFNWNQYGANHETFPSNPANDENDFLTFVYLNRDGIHFVTCEEGESIAYNDDKTELYRQPHTGEYYIPHVPMLPEFGKGWECSWAAALTSALQAMGHKTSYEQVMGVSGAGYRLAFCSPGWDYSSVDGLVAYDYATPAFKAFGYKEERHGRIEKADRVIHRERIMKEIRNHMPVLGINLRVAPEWGVIGGYKENGEVLFCRTKYDKPTIDNDPQFMKGHAEFKKEWLGPYDYMQVDNWPFLISYFTEHNHQTPSEAASLIASLKVFIDGSQCENRDGYHLGFKAYETWISDLLDDEWYDKNDDEQFARRFSVNQFCALALFDARKAAYIYLNDNIHLLPHKANEMQRITELFKLVSEKAEQMHQLLDSGEYLEGAKARQFWTKERRLSQTDLLAQMLKYEQEALIQAENAVATVPC